MALRTTARVKVRIEKTFLVGYVIFYVALCN